MRWIIKPKPDPEEVRQLATSLNVDELVATLLVQRGIKTYDQAFNFFRPQLADLHDPFLMKDMDKAVDRLSSAIAEGENIMIFGDYDVDGTTAVSLMHSYISPIHQAVTTYIPDRYEEGYGVSIKGIDYASDNDISLIIALDCGIKAIEQVAYAREKGIDFIICDHHTPGDQLPDAVAVLDPKRKDCEYPYIELCGCGVGFKLCQAMEASQDGSSADLESLLDLVAIAIAADIVPMTGENRILSYHGMKQINENPRPGIKALMRSLNKQSYNTTDVVFTAAPRINAAGRMKHGAHAVELLTEEDPAVAIELAEAIDAFNIERREADGTITEEALQQILDHEETEAHSTVVKSDHWHKGVLGIVASRLIETYYRPTIVFGRSGDMITGSARSVKGFNIYDALDACSEHLQKFGGHKYAAGLTLEEKNYAEFKSAFELYVSENLDEKLRHPELMVDMTIPIEKIDHKLYRIIAQFAPFGPGNMTPVFMSENLSDTGYAKGVGEEGKHLKFAVKQDRNGSIGAIAFNLGDRYSMVSSNRPFMAAYTVDENVWNGRTSIQLKVKDIKPT